MVSITSTTTITWSTGYNGRLTIKNNSTINYSSKSSSISSSYNLSYTYNCA